MSNETQPKDVNGLLIDPWSFASFKGRFSDSVNSRTWAAPTWVTDTQDRRRLQAYMLYESYCQNMARIWLDDTADEQDIKTRREYGDPSMLVAQITSSVLGQDWNILVPGAEEPTKGSKDSQSGDPTPSPEWKALTTIREWAALEKFTLKILDNEENQCKLGDSVIVLGWDAKKKRVRMNVWDPGFYFPVWSDDGTDEDGFDEEFPSKIHLAYEFLRQIDGRDEPHVRRITYELAPRVEDEDKEDPPMTCWMSDGVWRLRNHGIKDGIYDLSEDRAEWRVQDLDLKIDFIPVIHFPNLPTGSDQWGVSSLAPVLQIIDDLQATDTDLQATSAIVGSPPIALSGAQAPTDANGRMEAYGPRTVWALGDGSMDVLDVSDGLVALISMKAELLERLSINSRVPESMLGRIKPSDVPSGIALWLSFGPHSGMISVMRLIRDDKYSLTFKFIQRFMQANGVLETVVPCTLGFGSYLPADKMETIKMVVEAMNATISPISLETAVQMLLEAGIPIEDAATEIRRVESRMYEEALSLVQAVGDLNAGRRLLGYEDAATDNVPTDGPDPVEDEDEIDFG